jgi:hypothetical protein
MLHLSTTTSMYFSYSGAVRHTATLGDVSGLAVYSSIRTALSVIRTKPDARETLFAHTETARYGSARATYSGA